MQKENLFFFSFPRRNVFGEAKVQKKTGEKSKYTEKKVHKVLGIALFFVFLHHTNPYWKPMPAIFSKIRKEDSENTRQWDLLVTRLIEGNVIPVIGPGFLVDDEKGSNPHQILIDDSIRRLEQVDGMMELAGDVECVDTDSSTEKKKCSN